MRRTRHHPKTDEEWRRLLTPEQFEVCRRGGTEAPFAGRYWDAKNEGSYCCVCCGNQLFGSETKFDSGSGWPSFWDPIDPEKVTIAEDRGHGMLRLEVKCSGCQAHLGHLFDDGPEPTGRRYCINSVALKHQEDD